MQKEIPKFRYFSYIWNLVFLFEFTFTSYLVNSMTGVGKKTRARLIAEIGDINRFNSANSIVAYAGIDTPPYQSGSFYATERHITKRRK